MIPTIAVLFDNTLSPVLSVRTVSTSRSARSGIGILPRRGPFGSDDKEIRKKKLNYMRM